MVFSKHDMPKCDFLRPLPSQSIERVADVPLCIHQHWSEFCLSVLLCAGADLEVNLSGFCRDI